MNTFQALLIGGSVILGVSSFFVLLFVLFSYYQSPFSFPYLEITFDVSRTRSPKIEDYIDRYLIDDQMVSIDRQIDLLKQWKQDCVELISKSHFRKKRQQQFNECLDEQNLFVFIFSREQTRYIQRNYVRMSYKKTVEINRFTYSYGYLKERYEKLKKIHFSAVLSEYHSKNQRKLMTKELREQIAIRDNFTCKLCGKYMPDSVGLQIDHIVPVSKGGKSIPSNLQVLCSKCNGKKSSS